MARAIRTVVDYTDDMTGQPIAEEQVDAKFRFSVDGVDFQMDTDSSIADELREVLSRAAANGTIEYHKPKIEEPKVRRKPTNPDRTRLLKRIRFWANENGRKVAKQGRIPEDVVVAYRTANPGVDMTPYDKSH
ncbi:histone-like nucleoid-structuring protein Lsr2 [Streptomyces xanthochromogenes]|uniref:Lsr2 dimerization domain-containing protein n=1 Tax=Streptomyces xanthochromogenes TaxID=67384 RepID=UPI0037F4EFA5